MSGDERSGLEIVKYTNMYVLQDGTLSIYETPSFGLLDKKSIKVRYLYFLYTFSSTTAVYYLYAI
jgi:hypothetical protein